VKELFSSIGRVFFILCVVAFFVNIGLLGFSYWIPCSQESFELQSLAIINMILLSFVLLRDTKQKSG